MRHRVRGENAAVPDDERTGKPVTETLQGQRTRASHHNGLRPRDRTGIFTGFGKCIDVSFDLRRHLAAKRIQRETREDTYDWFFHVHPFSFLLYG